MTNAELLPKIKAEIERLKSIEYPCDNSQQETGFFNALDRMTDFLDTLESEKPINLDDAMKELDEKIALVKQRGTWDGVDVDKYMDEVRGREPEKPIPADLEEAADEYAEKHGFRVPYDGSDNFYDEVDVKASKEGFIAGAKWQKSQIMNEAVEADVNTYQDLVAGKSWAEFVVDMPTNHLCDKVKIIIVKEDEK